MAKSKLRFTKSNFTKLSITGGLNESGNIITYYDEDGNEQNIRVLDLLKPFKGNEITISIGEKSEEELDIVDDEPDDFDDESPFDED